MVAKKKATAKKKVVKKVAKKKVVKKKTVKKDGVKSEKKPAGTLATSEGTVLKIVESKPVSKVKGPAGVKSAKGEATVVVAKEDTYEKSTGKNVVFLGGKAVEVNDNDDSFLN